MEALITACFEKSFPAEVALVLSNNPAAQGLLIAQDAGIPTKTINHKDYENRKCFDEALTHTLEIFDIELVCLAGFMRLLSDQFCNRWCNKLINIHPSLLPAFKGLNVHKRMIDAGVKISGCTVHFVRSAMDDGPIIIQAAIPVAFDDTPEDLAARILKEEHLIYPMAVKWIAEGRLKIFNDVIILKNIKIPTTNIINPALDLHKTS